MELQTPDGSKRGLIELIVLVGAVVIDLWFLRGLANPISELPAICLVVGVLWISIKRRGGLRQILSIRKESSGKAWLEMVAATTVSATGLLLLGSALRGSYDEIPLKIVQTGVLGFGLWIGQHLVWAAMQQGILLLFLRPVIGDIVRGSIAASVATALVFGVLHLPCLILFISTFFLGLLWMALFTRNGRIIPIIVSHAILSAIAFAAIPPQWNCELLVGVMAQRKAPQYRALKSPQTRIMLETVTSRDYFSSSGGTDRGFIKSLYRDMLGRVPAEPEVEHWISLMSHGYSRNRIAVEFAGSREFRDLTSKTSGTRKGS